MSAESSPTPTTRTGLVLMALVGLISGIGASSGSAYIAGLFSLEHKRLENEQAHQVQNYELARERERLDREYAKRDFDELAALAAEFRRALDAYRFARGNPQTPATEVQTLGAAMVRLVSDLSMRSTSVEVSRATIRLASATAGELNASSEQAAQEAAQRRYSEAWSNWELVMLRELTARRVRYLPNTAGSSTTEMASSSDAALAAPAASAP